MFQVAAENTTASRPMNGISLRDIPFLASLVLVPIFGGRLSGESNFLALFGVYAIFEAAFLAWLIRALPKSIARNRVMTFAFQMQGQAAVQVVTRLVSLIVCTFFIDWVSAESGTRDVVKELEFLGLVAGFFATVVLMYAISIAWWRCLSLLRNGVDIAEVVDGSFKHKSIAVPASRQTVSRALDKYLERLKSPGAPRFSRMLYQADARIETVESNGQRLHAISWALLPIRVCVSIIDTSDTSSELHWHCELRGGIHRLEVFPAPALVLAAMRFLRTNLFQPLTSELALSGAVLKQDELRHKALESQLRILQAQIEPHFLFNTLANVRHLYRSSVEEGESMMDHLIVYLRCTLEELRSDVSTVSKEMDLALHYLAIMKIRMGDRLSYSFIHSDEVSACAFPPAMLISLLENAIKHGLNNKADGKLTISAVREEGHLRVTVLDNGPGFSSVQGTGVGLSNIRQRLEAIYGNYAWLEVGALQTGGFMASIVIPLPANE